jgi:hypothetical protein
MEGTADAGQVLDRLSCSILQPPESHRQGLGYDELGYQK